MNAISHLDENALTPYPLSEDIGFNSVIVDANFIQFDGFIPVLQAIKVNVDNVSSSPQVDIVFTILFDSGVQNISVTTSNSRVSIVSNGRYLGTLTFGQGLSLLSVKFANKLITLNTSFLASTVRSVNSQGGLYSLDSKFGDVSIHTDENMYFNISANDVTWNCVGFPNNTGGNALKTLNGVSPVNNSIYLSDSTLLRIASGTASLTFSSIGDSSQIFPTTP